MNENPWRVDDIARAQRERIRDEMREIRLEEKALRARPERPAWISRFWLFIRRWFASGQKQAAQSSQHHVKRQSHVRSA